MYPFERLNKIMEHIQSEGQIKIREDAGLFGVSNATLHRDLDRLEQQGLIQKVRGGAVLRLRLGNNSHFDQRLQTAARSKERLAEAAVEIIRDDTSIFLDHSTTITFLARALAKKNYRNLIVATNSLVIPEELANISGIQVILTGGVVEHDFKALSGRWVIESFRGFNFNQVFVSCGAISPEGGIMTQTPFIHEIISEILSTPGTMVNLLADHSKFSKIATFRAGPLRAADRIYTDKTLPKALNDKIRALGPQLIAAK